MSDLATAWHELGRHAQAEALAERALEMFQRLYEPHNPIVLECKSNLAAQYWKHGRLDKSVPMFEQILEARSATLGRQHADTLDTVATLGVNYKEAGRIVEALPLLDEARAAWREHPSLTFAAQSLAHLYWTQKKLDKSVPLYEEVVKAHEASLGRQHAVTIAAAADLGVNYKDAGRLAEAIPLLEHCYRSLEDGPTRRVVGQQLLDAYVRTADAGKPWDVGKVTALVEEVLLAARAALPAGSAKLAQELANAASLLARVGARDAALPLLRECLAIREKVQPDAWTTFHTKSVLGGALLGLGLHAEAEPLLLAGYRGMKEREASIPPQAATRLAQALERLVQLYEATGKAAAAAAWRREMQATPAPDSRPATRRSG